jgi:hypothetical protein
VRINEAEMKDASESAEDEEVGSDEEQKDGASKTRGDRKRLIKPTD